MAVGLSREVANVRCYITEMIVQGISDGGVLMILPFNYRYSLNSSVGSFLVYSVVIVIPHFLQHVSMKFVQTVLIKFMIVLINGKYFATWP